MISTIEALFLKRIIFNKFHITDIFIPILFLSPAQLEIYINTPNLAHGAFPLFGIITFALVWQLKNLHQKILISLVLSFILAHSGFGLFFSFLFPLLIISEKNHLHKEKSKQKLYFLILFTLSITIPILFFLNYNWNVFSEVKAFTISRSILFICLMTGHTFLGIFTENFFLFTGVGAVLALIMITIFLKQIPWPWHSNLKHTKKKQKEILFIFLGFSMLFIIISSTSRSSMDINNALNSRYYPYLIPGILAIYFIILKNINDFIIAKLIIIAILLFSFYRLRTEDLDAIKVMHQRKTQWIYIYKKFNNIELSNSLSKIKIHLDDRKLLIKNTFSYLKDNKLNIYAKK